MARFHRAVLVVALRSRAAPERKIEAVTPELYAMPEERQSCAWYSVAGYGSLAY